MKTIGVIVAVEIEAFVRTFGQPEEKRQECGFYIYQYSHNDKNIIVCDSGAGEIAGAAAAQYLISKYEAEVIINFGVAGGLTKDIKTYDNCIVKNVVHYDYDISEFGDFKVGQYMYKKDRFFEVDENLFKLTVEKFPTLKIVNCASGDKFISKKEKRINYGKEFNCQICEMEAAGILITCRRNKIPCLMIKSISDSVVDGANEFLDQADRASDICFEIIEVVIDMI